MLHLLVVCLQHTACAGPLSSGPSRHKHVLSIDQDDCRSPRCTTYRWIQQNSHLVHTYYPRWGQAWYNCLNDLSVGVVSLSILPTLKLVIGRALAYCRTLKAE